MTRWAPFLVLALATTGCLAELDDAADPDADADAEVRDEPAPTVTKANRWAREAALDGPADARTVGWSVALDGDTAVVGVRHGGSARVFERRGDRWDVQATLRGTGTASDEFGTAVAVHGDTAVVGAWGDDSEGTDAGAVYVFTRTDGTWRRTSKLTAPDAAGGDRFGIAVAYDGSRIVVGADMDDAPDRPDAGAGYVFQRDGGGWALDQKLVADTRFARKHLGYSVAIDGRWIVLGAPAAFYAGSAFVFRRGLASRWHQRAELEGADVVAAGDQFGEAVAIHGATVLVGAPGWTWVEGQRGAVYVFTQVESEWDQRGKLVASDAGDGDAFGRSLALVDGVAVVGAWQADDEGAAYVFTGSGDRWTQRQRLGTGDSDEGTLFGFSVAASGERILVGAHGDRQPGSIGAAHVFVRE
jgi:hypothetical protein